MKRNMFFLVIGATLILSGSAWAQQQPANPEVVARLEQMASESDWKARTLSGAVKQKWLLHERRINGLVEKLKKGQQVDPKEIDEVLKEHYR